MPFRDLSGQVFDRLTVIKRVDPPSGLVKATFWLCLCECGQETRVRSYHLQNRKVRSCGCLRSENLANYPATHQQTGSATYSSWKAMKGRCYDPRNKRWNLYGGRGIKVCDRWLGPDGFSNFLQDMGERPDGMTLDRIKSDKDYCLENCRWATCREQRLNTSRTNWLTYQGETLCLSDWAKRLGMSRGTIQNRLKQGWSVERTLGTPPR